LGQPTENYLHSTFLDVLSQQISRLEWIGIYHGRDGKRNHKKYTYADYLTWPDEERWEISGDSASV
jgi:hypothetical protein